jgi:hypothetical protein
MEQVPTSQNSGPGTKTAGIARYNQIFNIIQDATYKGANVLSQGENNKFLKRHDGNSNAYGNQGVYSSYNSNLLPFNPI